MSQSTTGLQFSLTAAVTIALSSLLTVNLTIGTVASGHVYSLTLNGHLVSYTAGGTDTAATIAAALISAINALSISTISVTNSGWRLHDRRERRRDGVLPLCARRLHNGLRIRFARDLQLHADGPKPRTRGKRQHHQQPDQRADAVTNPAAGVLGNLAETDPAFRMRRLTALLGGNATDVAIANYIYQNVPGVTFAYCVSNRLNVPDVSTGPRTASRSRCSEGRRRPSPTRCGFACPAVSSPTATPGASLSSTHRAIRRSSTSRGRFRSTSGSA